MYTQKNSIYISLIFMHTCIKISSFVPFWLKSVSSKRRGEDFSAETSRKKLAWVLRIELDSDEEVEEKFFIFLQVGGPPSEMLVQDLVILVRREYEILERRTESPKPKRQINWSCKNLHFVDAFENKITKMFDFKNFKPNRSHMLRLCDGSAEADKYENMWDLTPDTGLLKELPEEYTFETALADLIDNSLQAVWSNHANQRRLISLELTENRITIFDTGPGMDGSVENSIVKWGKMGASLHRLSRDKGIGGNPPYLTPFFGMFGYGGPIASMHLGRRASVSSKTKECKKVFVLHLDRESLLRCSSSQKTWRTDGKVRDPLEDELRDSTNGSFTKVEIFYLKMRSESIKQLQYKLKDIYFPYIQCDEVSSTGKTMMPIEFQVNGTNLAEIEGGEVATTNLLSCNGPEFVMQLSFHAKDSNDIKVCSGKKSSLLAHARLRCVYFPVMQGKESIEMILEKLEEDGCGITENFESFSHVSVRRLGRLLPDARWSWLPFMEPKLRKSDRAEVLKRCCFRVKCFIETDAGFNPTPSKTDLAHHHPCTIALRNFGNKPSDKETDILVEISKDGKKLSLMQMEKLYQDWMFQMHDRYDEEIDCGEDQPTFVVGPLNKKELGVSSEVLRIHKVFRRKGITWKSGQKIKILKGACKGFHKNNVFATLEFIILEGWQGDSAGDARIICRPLNVPDGSGCRLILDKGSACFEIHNSKSLPISVIDAGKCISVDNTEWENQILKHQHKITPSSIDILDAEQCRDLDIEALPQDVVDAGHEPPEEIAAVIRRASFSSVTASKSLDPKYIMKENFEMTLEIKFKADETEKELCHIYSGLLTPSALKGFHGLYLFPLKKKLPDLFQKAGIYLFQFSLKESHIISVKEVHVKALSVVASWELLSDERSMHSASVGSCFPKVLRVVCCDRFSNRIPFKSDTATEMKLSSGYSTISSECSYGQYITCDSYTMKFKDVTIESSELDMIRPSYKSYITYIFKGGSIFCSYSMCRYLIYYLVVHYLRMYKILLFPSNLPLFTVFPGPLQRVLLCPVDFGKKLVPGMIIKELNLETFDKYGNHLRKDEHVKVTLEGLQLLDKGDSFPKVNDHGFVNLGGTLKVTAGYGKPVSLSILSGDEVVFNKEFQTERRSLRVASKVPKACAAGSHLEDVVFEVINSAGEVDEDIDVEEEDGHSHTLLIRQESLMEEDNVRYSFHRGRCVVRSIPLPNNEGLFCFVASHSRFHELQTRIEVHVEKAVISKHEVTQPRSVKKEILLLEDSYSLEVPGTVYDNTYDGSIMLFKDSCASMDLEERVQKLGDDICRYGLCIRQCEASVESLNIKQSNVELERSNLEGINLLMLVV
ncbi:unnamed protein product [Withania somnifera]